MNDGQAQALASRFIRLIPEKRKIFLEALARENVDFATFPIVSSAGEPARCQLSYTQQRMWFLWQLDPESAAYNLPTVTELKGLLNVEALTHALNSVVTRHEVLRTLFPTDDQGQPYQLIRDNLVIDINVEDLVALPSHEQDEAVRERIERESLIPFDLVSGPLLRVKLFALAEHRYVLMITLHHIVADGWSLNILINELMRFYKAYVTNTDADVAPLPIQYADYALWQRAWLESGELQRQLDYWCEQLEGDQPVLQLPVDHARTSERSFIGARYEWKIDDYLANSLRMLARQHNASLFMVLLAAFKVLLYRYTGEPDIRIGVPVANRHRPETEGLIGCFINTQVMRAEIDFQETFTDLLETVRKNTLDAQTNQDLPFEQLVNVLQPARNLAHNPLFQVLFNHQALAADVTNLTTSNGLQICPFAWDKQTTQFDLKLDTWEIGGQLCAAFTYAPDVFDISTIETLSHDWLSLLTVMVKASSKRIGDISLLDSASFRRILREWNNADNTALVLANTNTKHVHTLFEEWAALTPDTFAVVGEAENIEARLTYNELNVQANQLARHLQKLGIGPDIPVGITLERSPILIVAILAVLKAGGAYVPLDPEYPEQRLRYMIADSGVNVLLTQKKLRDHLSIAKNITVINLDSKADVSAWHQADETNLATSGIPANLAYIIYTSGTTGKPKGVAVSHGNLCNYLQAVERKLMLPAMGNFAMVSTFAADLGNTMLYGALCGGRTLHLLQKESTLDAEWFAKYIERHAITVMKMVPGHLQGLLQAHNSKALLPSQCLILGGEACSPALVQRVQALRPDCRIINHYGPTETTVGVLTHSIEPNYGQIDSIALGQPLANCCAYVLDDGFNPTPEKALGELFIGGAGLARGYYGKAAATAERFVPNPFSESGGERLYRSGDRVQRNQNSDVMFRGRFDSQIKIRGFRIEIDEIESHLRQSPEVIDAAVLMAQDERGDPFLVAYVVPRDSVLVNATDELHNHFCATLKTGLLQVLPEYMVPNHYRLLVRMPITVNGKLDRKALPAIDINDLQRQYRPPQTLLQQQIATVWQEVLGVERVGLDDNFFERGGHSLLITQVVARLRRTFKMELPLRILFESDGLEDFCQTVAELVKYIDLDAQEQVIKPVPRDQPLPLSFAQTRQWLLWQMEPNSAAYNVNLAFRIRGKLDIQALEKSFDYLMARHEIWCTHFEEDGGATYQVITAPQSFNLIPEPVPTDVDLETMLHALGREPFDLRTGPLLRVRLLQLGEQHYLLVVTQHHVISDGWSMQVLVNELADIYAAFRQEHEPNITPLPIQYADFAQWQRHYWNESEKNRQLGYWQQRLGDDHPVLELPADFPRPAHPSFAGANHTFTLTHELAQKIGRQARLLGVTSFMWFLASFQILLYRYSGQEQIRVGAPIANRTRLETEKLVGFFVNTQVHRADITGNMTVDGLLCQTKRYTLEAQEHQDLPFEQLVAALQPERSLSFSPLFQVMFNYQAGHGVLPISYTARLGNLHVEEMTWDEGAAQFDLTLEIAERVTGTVVRFNYATDLFERSTIERLAYHWQRLLAEMVKDPSQRIAEIPLLDKIETHRILREWNDTAVDYGTGTCIHSLFEAQAEKTPEATALIFPAQEDQPEQMLTYAQLNAKANQLAHTLRGMGVGPDVLVGIAAERSIEMVIGLLGILKAGGAYVPLDPKYPEDRLSYMMTDSGINLLLTQEWLQERLPIPEGVQVLNLDGQSRADWHQESDENLPLITLPGNLAYIIYTSGSTGKPKGVAIAHGSAFMLLNWSKSVYRAEDLQGVFAATSICFDLSVWELFAPLSWGGGVVLAENALSLPHHSARDKVSLINTVPSAITALLRNHQIPANVRTVNLAGEALKQSLVEELYAAGIERVFDLYGPSEDTTYSTGVLRVVSGKANIGHPIANTQTYILTGDLQLVPTRVAGELYIAGAGLARGYYGKPNLTAERFVPDPYGEAGGRLYRTGDLVRYQTDGNIEYIGRIDHQVKIRGFRIELGEIESQLNAQAEVKEAVVIAQQLGGIDDQQLVAYIVPNDSTLVDEAIDTNVQNTFRSVVKAQLQAILPEYMVPNQYVLLDKLPLTPNGKLDRKALPKIDGSVFQRTYEAPRTELEQQLASIWQEVLGVEKVGLNDNFFELGGHSLLAIQLLSHVCRQSWVASVRDLFQYPQLGNFARVLEQSSDRTKLIVPHNRITEDCQFLTPEMVTLVALEFEELASIEAMIPGGAANIQDVYPLVPLQEGILFHHLLEDKGDIYVLLQTISFVSLEKLEQFIDSFNRVIARHDILRTAILWERLREPVQIVCRQALLALQWLEVDKNTSTADQLSAYVNKTHYRIDIRRAPMIEAIAAYDSERDRYLLQLTNHHLISDNTTLEMIIREIGLIQEGRETDLPGPLPFRNFVAQARLGVSQEEHESFFTQMLGDVEESSAPFDLMNVTGDGSDIGEIQQSLPKELALALRQQAQRYGVSAASLFHLAWGLVVAKTSSREDAVFGTVLFGRMQGVEGAERALGLFINTLPLRIALQDQSVEQALRKTHETLAKLVHHEHASLALAQRCSALPGGTPLFSSLLNYRYSDPKADENTRAAWDGMEILGSEVRTNYPITLSVNDLGEGFSLNVQVSRILDASRLCGYMVEALDSLVKALLKDPLRRISELSIFNSGEIRRILREWNANTVDHGEDSYIHSLFEEQVERTPEAIALIFSQEGIEQSLTYVELNSRANQLAHRLRSLGVGPDVLVGIAVERSVEVVVGLLAILKAGGAYVPLDPKYPQERLAYMLVNSGIRLLLTQSTVLKCLPLPQAITAIDLSIIDLSDERTKNPRVPLSQSNLAYVLYTSGSTGRPKGVAMPHMVVSKLIAWHLKRLPGNYRTLLFASPSFDVAFQEVMSSLASGGTLIQSSDEQRQDLSALLRLVAEQRVERIFLPFAVLQLFAELALTNTVGLPALKQVITAGEQLKLTAALRTWLKQESQCQLINQYGPTESHVVSDYIVDDLDEQELPPIGRPASNANLYVLDANLEPVPVGVTGELYIGSDVLARGYLSRPDLTAERFVPDPYDEQGGSRLYRTGNLARYRTGGNIEYVGRIDHQVKIRGFRIELGEIESQLNAQAIVKESVVIAQQVSEAGGQQLVAYVVPGDSALIDEAIDADIQNIFRASVKAQLQAVLPEYMVPNQYVLLDKLPLTPNGKLDRKALPKVDGNTFQRVYEAPQTELEQQLASIWQEVLGVEQVGRNDNFFELGGHSLLATQLVSRIRQSMKIKSNIKLRDIFQMRNLKELAKLWDEPPGPNNDIVDYPPISNQKRKESLSLSLAQQRLWLVDQLFNTGTAYNISTALDVQGPLSLSILEKSFTVILQRHEILRTAYTIDNEDRPVAIIENNVNLPVVITDVSQQLLPDQELAQKQWLQDCEQEVIDISRPPLVRMNVIKLSENHHQIFFAMHHIISDGWSMRILVDELTESYQSYICNKEPNLKSLPVQYMDYALWQQQLLKDGYLEQEKAFWQKNLDDVPHSLSLPQKRKTGGDAEFSGSSIVLELSESLSERLRQLAGASNATSHQLLMACFQLLLHRLTSVPDLVVGTDLAGRTQQELESLIGFFVNVLPMRSRYNPQQTFSGYLEAICANALDVYEHQILPLDMIIESCSIPRISGENPLIQILFVTNNVPQSEINIDELHLNPLERGQEHSKFDIAVFVSEFAGKFVCNWTFKTAVYQRETIEGFIANWQFLLDQIVENPLIPLAAIKLEPLVEQSPNIISGTLPSTEDAMDQKLKKLGGFVKKRKNKSQSVAGNSVPESKRSLVRISPLRENQQFPLIAEPQARNVDIVVWIQNNRAFVDNKLLSHGCIVFRGFELPAARDFERFAEAIHPGLYDRYGDLPKRKDGDRIYHSTPYPEDKMILFHNESSHQDRWPRKQLFYCEIPSVQGGATPLVDCREMYRLLPVELARRFEEEGLLYVRTFDKNFDVSWQHFFRTDNRQDVEQRCEKSGIEWRWLEGDGLQIRTRGPGVITHPISGEKSFFNQIQLHHHYHLDTDVRTDLLNTLGSDFMPRHVYFGDGSVISDETMQYLADLYEQCAVRFPWQQHDVVLVDNMSVAHARDPYRGPRKIVVAMGDMYEFTGIAQKPRSLEAMSGSSAEFDNSVTIAEVDS